MAYHDVRSLSRDLEETRHFTEGSRCRERRYLKRASHRRERLDWKKELRNTLRDVANDR